MWNMHITAVVINSLPIVEIEELNLTAASWSVCGQAS